jgi:hypothetical protein
MHTNTTLLHKPFDINQRGFINTGAINLANLKEWVRSALQVTKKTVVVKRHWYIASSPGLGKTYTVLKTCEEAGIDPVLIQGDISLPAFTRKMAYACYVQQMTKSDKPIIVVVDDCDSLFANKDGLNVMKGILDLEREVLSYEKDMTGQIKRYREANSETTRLIACAIEHFQTQGGLGISIPMQNVIFIFLTNRDLATLQEAQKKPKLIDEAAVRNRVQYKRIPDRGRDLWGYNANVILSSDILGDEHKLSEPQKMILLDWMYTNWDNLQSTSIRDVMDMAATMINHPTDYVDHWNQNLIGME